MRGLARTLSAFTRCHADIHLLLRGCILISPRPGVVREMRCPVQKLRRKYELPGKKKPSTRSGELCESVILRWQRGARSREDREVQKAIRRESFSRKSSSIRANSRKTPPLKRGISVLFLLYHNIALFSSLSAPSAFAFSLQTLTCISLSCLLQICPVIDRKRWLLVSSMAEIHTDICLDSVSAASLLPASACAFKANLSGENTQQRTLFANLYFASLEMDTDAKEIFEPRPQSHLLISGNLLSPSQDCASESVLIPMAKGTAFPCSSSSCGC